MVLEADIDGDGQVTQMCTFVTKLAGDLRGVPSHDDCRIVFSFPVQQLFEIFFPVQQLLENTIVFFSGPAVVQNTISFLSFE